MSDKIRPHHLARKALLYIRQSSPYQVQHNQESQRLQYAMKGRLEQLGWSNIEIIDEDLGCSAAGTVIRSGFEALVAQVCLGQVGAVAAREMSRFARNSREWQHLVELCRMVDTLLVDQESVYAPRQGNDLLLLGLKGSLNEYELELLRQRSLEARYEKARRGELLVAAPVGYLKTEDQRLEKDPDQRVQEIIRLLFDTFLNIGTVRQTLLWFLEHDLSLPVRTPRGELIWRRPNYGMVYRMLTQPAYGGAYAYGKTETVSCPAGPHPQTRTRRKPQAQWLTLIPGAHEGYIDWARFELIQQMITQNVTGKGQSGAPRHGPALLAGLLRCRRCGRKLVVRYTGSNSDVLRYGCERGWLDNAAPRCIAFSGQAVDRAVGQALLRVVQPAAVEAAVQAGAQQAGQREQILEILRRDVQAARYAAQRAFKQYDAADPENRLVTDELERRWNQALQRVQDLENRLETQTQQQAQTLVVSTEVFKTLAEDLEGIWLAPQTDPRLKKRIVRALIEEVWVDIDDQAHELCLILHWKGGVHTQLRLPRRRRGQSTQTSKEVVEAVRQLARLCSDQTIAGMLNRNGLRTGRGNWWTRERVTSLRSTHKIPCYCPQQRSAQGWMNLTEAAALLGVSSKTLRLAVERGELPAEHPLGNGPWIFHQQAVSSQAAIELVQRIRSRKGSLAVPGNPQQELTFSST